MVLPFYYMILATTPLLFCAFVLHENVNKKGQMEKKPDAVMLMFKCFQHFFKGVLNTSFSEISKGKMINLKIPGGGSDPPFIKFSIPCHLSIDLGQVPTYSLLAS